MDYITAHEFVENKTKCPYNKNGKCSNMGEPNNICFLVKDCPLTKEQFFYLIGLVE